MTVGSTDGGPASAQAPAQVPAQVPPVAHRLVDARQSLGQASLDDLFPEGPAFRRSVQTFVVLLALASLIAAFGLYQDSVAAIIGAMVVAPLGGAIMALAGALVTGRARWQTISLLQAALGALMVVGIGWIVAFVLPDPITLSPSLEARTSPGLLDLGVALAAGAAGAYVAARRTGSDALPGVAIAVSLVPPLVTVGICLDLRRYADAGGALLLFLTNFAAIVVVACVVFVILGAVPGKEMRPAGHRLRNGFIAAVLLLVIVAMPLAWNSADAVTSLVQTRVGAPIVRDWIGMRDLDLTGWTVEKGIVRISLVGPDAPPDAAPLASDLAKAYGKPVDVRITYTAVQRAQATATP